MEVIRRDIIVAWGRLASLRYNVSQIEGKYGDDEAGAEVVPSGLLRGEDEEAEEEEAE